MNGSSLVPSGDVPVGRRRRPHRAAAPAVPAGPHRLAVCTVTVVGTVGLGATVTTLGAGMAFLDWPTSGGENMLAYNFFSDIKAGADR